MYSYYIDWDVDEEDDSEDWEDDIYNEQGDLECSMHVCFFYSCIRGHR